MGRDIAKYHLSFAIRLNCRGEMTRGYWNINLEEMMEAGVHFGHGTWKWNPKMAPYISAKRKGIKGIIVKALGAYENCNPCSGSFINYPTNGLEQRNEEEIEGCFRCWEDSSYI
ncbi:hypothetical protein QVD17_41387 [Tagetes erecta]|uniref:Small ribosomal subunit protein uS2c n=1 Tax=Tagetes erecta TaxID=13708 RepID=A0AAD8JM14_TARER|nr:hypothetical protein QVD17_41387 [Tagetes erecta]